MRVVRFTGTLTLLSKGELVTLKTGSPAFSVGPGTELTLLSGEAWLLADAATVRADANDSLSLLIAEGRPALSVLAGTVEVTLAGETRGYGPGSLVWLRPAAPPSLPEPPPAAPDAAPSPATPWRGLRIAIELHPYYTLRETYDSNVNLVPPDRPGGVVVGGGVVGAWTTTNNLGMRLLMPLSRAHKVEANYDFRAVTYSRQGKTNNSMDQSVGVTYSYTGPRGISLGASNSYANTVDPPFSELTQRERRWQNSVGVFGRAPVSRKLFLHADGSHTTHKYLGRAIGGLLNHYEQSFGGGLGVQLTPKSDLRASYHRTIVHYSAGRKANSKGHSGDLAIQGKLTPRLRGTASVGVHRRDYDDVTGVIKAFVTTWQTAADLNYSVGRRTNLSLTASRAVTESTFGDNRFYTATRVGSGVMHAIGKLTLGVTGSFEVDHYPQSAQTGGIAANRRDDIYTLAGNADYRLKEWLSFGLSHQYLEKNSIFTGQFNYQAHRTSLEARVQF